MCDKFREKNGLDNAFYDFEALGRKACNGLAALAVKTAQEGSEADDLVDGGKRGDDDKVVDDNTAVDEAKTSIPLGRVIQRVGVQSSLHLPVRVWLQGEVVHLHRMEMKAATARKVRKAWLPKSRASKAWETMVWRCHGDQFVEYLRFKASINNPSKERLLS